MVTATPASLLASSLSLVLFPTLAEAWGRGDKRLFKNQTDNATRALILVMVTIFGTLILCSQLVMRTLWGQEYDAASPIFPILVAAILATNIAVATSNALSARSARGLQVLSAASFAGLALGALLWWLLTPVLGVLGVALGYLAGSAVAALVPMGVEWRVGGHLWHRLALRLAAGLGLLAILFAAERTLALPAVSEPLVALLFVAVWAGLSRGDLRLLPLRALTRRRR
jgi:putative peptidoglycan lipid II flippase